MTVGANTKIEAAMIDKCFIFELSLLWTKALLSQLYEDMEEEKGSRHHEEQCRGRYNVMSSLKQYYDFTQHSCQSIHFKVDRNYTVRRRDETQRASNVLFIGLSR